MNQKLNLFYMEYGKNTLVTCKCTPEICSGLLTDCIKTSFGFYFTRRKSQSKTVLLALQRRLYNQFC